MSGKNHSSEESNVQSYFWGGGGGGGNKHVNLCKRTIVWSLISSPNVNYSKSGIKAVWSSLLHCNPAEVASVGWLVSRLTQDNHKGLFQFFWFLTCAEVYQSRSNIMISVMMTPQNKKERAKVTGFLADFPCCQLHGEAQVRCCQFQAVKL